MTRLLVVFNHTLTRQQTADAKTKLGVQEIVNLPAELEKLWGQVPPEIDDLAKYLEPLIQWLSKESHKDDYILIQGEFGAAYYLVSWAESHGLKPIYSTTRRNAVETSHPDGSVSIQHNFYHVQYRPYNRWRRQ